MSEYLFVYGTLLSGLAKGQAATLMSRLSKIGPATMNGRLYDFGGFPGAILGEWDSRIKGEVYEISDGRTVELLDSYEEFDSAHPQASLFVRKQATAQLDDGEDIVCWVYVYNRDPGNAPLVIDGDYSKARRS